MATHADMHFEVLMHIQFADLFVMPCSIQCTHPLKAFGARLFESRWGLSVNIRNLCVCVCDMKV